MSGFWYQIALSIEELLEAAKAGSEHGIFFDSLGDLTRRKGDLLYLTQAKATLTLESAKAAALEALDVDAFLADTEPKLRDVFRFAVWCRRREGRAEPSRLSATQLGLTGSEARRWLQLRLRILPAEIRPTPFLRLVLHLFDQIDDPFALVDSLVGALLRLLGDDAESEQIALELLHLIATKRRSTSRPPGRLLQAEDFNSASNDKTHILVGDRPLLSDLTDGCFMPRLHLLHAVLEALSPYLSLRDQNESSRAVPIVWIDGGSGCGKSVILLQVLEHLVLEQDTIVHLLPPSSSKLAEAFKYWSTAARPVVIAVDDLYPPNNRDNPTWREIHEASLEGRWQKPPILLTCGPSEYRRACEEEVQRGGGMYVISVEIPPLTSGERLSYSQWYSQRTGKLVPQLAQDNFATLAFLYDFRQKGEPPDLRQFAQRLRDRLVFANLLEEVLLVMVGTVLGFRLPRTLFSGKDDACEALIREHWLRALPTENGPAMIAFLHPRVAAALYTLIIPSDALHLKTDHLIGCFGALCEDLDSGKEFLRFLGKRAKSAFTSVAIRKIAIERIWSLLVARIPNATSVPLLRSWSIAAQALEVKLPEAKLAKIREWLIKEDLQPALWAVLWEILHDQSLNKKDNYLLRPRAGEWLERHTDFFAWPFLWLRLWSEIEEDKRLIELAEFWLELFPDRQGWSYIYQRLSESKNGRSSLGQLGLLWLKHGISNIADPYVWEKLLNSDPDQGLFVYLLTGRLCRCLISAVNRNGCTLVASLASTHSYLVDDMARALLEPENRASVSWGYVWRNLCSLLPDIRDVMARVGYHWLDCQKENAHWFYVWSQLYRASGAEDRKRLWNIALTWLTEQPNHVQWSYVWRKLLRRTEEVDRQFILTLGRDWLAAHQDQRSWNLVWQDVVKKCGARDLGLTWQMGQEWLDDRQDRMDWNYVWQGLMDTSPSILAAEQIWRMGRDWLAGREDRPDWNYVWQKLLDTASTEREADQIKKIGSLWIRGRQERPNWSHVWRGLLAAASPDEIPWLWKIGHTWLAGRASRADWNFVWNRLLATARPAEFSQLWDVGREWLNKRLSQQYSDECNYTWQVLLDTAPPKEIVSLRAIGWKWLYELEGPGWSPVWERLYKGASVDEVQMLREMGFTWLERSEAQPDWGFVWKVLVESASREESAGLRDKGRRWLDRWQDHRGWNHVWHHLLRLASEEEAIWLRKLGLSWVEDRQDNAYWHYVWSTLSELEPWNTKLMELADSWLRERRDKSAARVVSLGLRTLKRLKRRH